jgi:hypothetical protein
VTVTTRNHAAERLLNTISIAPALDDAAKQLLSDHIEGALAVERDLMAKRIRGPIHAYLYAGRDWVGGLISEEQFQEVKAEFDRILDEVAR